MDIDDKKLKPFKAKALEYIKDKDKSMGLLNEAIQKASAQRNRLGEVWEKLHLLFGVFRDWLNGSYKELPKRSLFMIVLGIVYFVSPIDGVFDYIPFGGLIDDAAVAGFVISQVSADLEKYKLWKKQVNSEIESEENRENSS
ncbi:YkvA family protein [Desulfosporosinus meridiei]|uniref:DUF1232 domain-containing protein n=1 Tax=Desulfosporosinus meridiei (strain ATCC BAA-275 / DSM 13257 / KCTC 12902 / NCIMB 13706 / S10) TaxID=768704 RepID=J7IVD1_DESMD|nr:YkvA family protein [Desulfosporosinus meridiei]AFQ44114.1 hypothetical protein Desmer_2175 [Desulfosporosinus meridiei DSM 13257]